MLQNAYFLAKIEADTAENEQHFAQISDLVLDVREVRVRHAAVADVLLAGLREERHVPRREAHEGPLLTVTVWLTFA